MSKAMYSSFLRAFFILLFCFYSNRIVAGVYHCIDQFGIPEFSDRPCFRHSHTQDFLPYIYQRTPSEKEHPVKKELAKTQKQLIALERKRILQNVRLQKQMKKEALKKARLQKRCVRTEEKVKIIENQLRLGCKLRRCQRLKLDLEHTLLMKNRYCGNG